MPSRELSLEQEREVADFNDAAAFTDFVAEFEASQIVVAGEYAALQQVIDERADLEMSAQQRLAADKSYISPMIRVLSGVVGMILLDVNIVDVVADGDGIALRAAGLWPLLAFQIMISCVIALRDAGKDETAHRLNAML